MTKSLLEQLNVKVTINFSKSEKDRVKVSIPEKGFDLISNMKEKDLNAVVTCLQEELVQGFPVVSYPITLIVHRGKGKNAKNIELTPKLSRYWIDESNPVVDYSKIIVVD